MKPVVSISLLALFFFSFSNTFSQNKNNSLDSIIHKKMTEAGIVGIAATIVNNKSIIWEKGYGYANQEEQLKFTPNTIINIGGISKSIIGFCLMQAVQEKKLNLDDDINKYLPFSVFNPFFPTTKITIRHLATHTSSILDRQAVYHSTYNYTGDSNYELNEFLESYFIPSGRYYRKENYLNKKPGTYYQYSNIAAGLAAYILEIVTKEKFNEYSKRIVFEPLKMKQSGWFLREINIKNHSKLYKIHGKGNFNLYGFPTYPDGGLKTSVSELSNFLICIANKGIFEGKMILKKEMVEEIIMPHFPNYSYPQNVDFSKRNDGLFMFLRVDENRFGNVGIDPGVNTQMYFDTKKNLGVILFCNTSLDAMSKLKFEEIYNEIWKYAYSLK